MTRAAGSICVVGSANLDIVTPVQRHPVAGETVLGGDHAQLPGGKGANQAVAAARLGGQVAFVGRVGDDPPGDTLRESLAEAGVELTHLRTTVDTPSGIATISVGPDGDNAIVVSPGANARLTGADIADAAPTIAAATIVLIQLEVPVASVIAAAAAADGTVILNPAPMSEQLPAELLAQVDLLVPNQTELALLADSTVEPTTVDQALVLAKALPTPRVVVTLGALGALVVDGDQHEHIPAPTVVPVDTTAAGDAFCAALAVELARRTTLTEAVAFAVRVGAAATLRPGAQPSLPSRDEVELRLGAGTELS